jgi:acetyltransferase-like isoleucine patch superfamily enzyme
MDIGEGTLISRKASLDVVNPKSIHIGKYTSLASAVLLTHDACRQMKADIFIGDNCFLGMRSIILPGIKIGNEVIVGAGSVVTKDVPSNCIVAGNPAKIIKEGITCGKLGRLISSNE